MEEVDPTGEAEESVELVKVRRLSRFRAICKEFFLPLNINSLIIVFHPATSTYWVYFSLSYFIPGRPEENGFEMTPGERGGDRGRRGRGRG